jgi:hypothetical protein
MTWRSSSVPRPLPCVLALGAEEGDGPAFAVVDHPERAAVQGVPPILRRRGVGEVHQIAVARADEGLGRRPLDVGQARQVALDGQANERRGHGPVATGTSSRDPHSAQEPS